MASYNKVIMMGNMTRDPQLSYLPSQTPVVEFGLATSRKWRDRDGNDREDTCFIDCRCFGKMAETISKYFSKGKPIMIEGRLTLDQWEAQDGSKRSKHRIMIDTFTFVGSRGDGGGNQGGGNYGGGSSRNQGGGGQGGDYGGGGNYNNSPPQGPANDGGGDFGGGDDEIPF